MALDDGVWACTSTIDSRLFFSSLCATRDGCGTQLLAMRSRLYQAANGIDDTNREPLRRLIDKIDSI